jgi:hypothetical protein
MREGKLKICGLIFLFLEERMWKRVVGIKEKYLEKWKFIAWEQNLIRVWGRVFAERILEKGKLSGALKES